MQDRCRYSKITDNFLRNRYPENVILSCIRSTTLKFNTIKSFGPVYVNLPWIGSVSQLIGDKISVSVKRRFNSVKVRTIFSSSPKDVLPKTSTNGIMVYKFLYQYDADYSPRGVMVKAMDCGIVVS